MKETHFAIVFALCAFLAVVTARNYVYPLGIDSNTALSACSRRCVIGPGYWCQNITNSGCCKATSYCISHQWSKLKVPEDHDSVCDICKNMVKQARDQLESNQTQEELKEVFEGSCALIHIKPIVRECDKLVDEFIPDLIETLASQMDPSVVCSVSGLCNSAYIDKLLKEYKDQPQVKKTEGQISLADDEYNPSECSKCYTIAHHIEKQVNQASRDQVLERFLYICGEFSSFSDSCASIVLTHFDALYSHLKQNFKTESICHLSGQCTDKFHVHEDENKPIAVEVRPLSSVGVVDIGDDLPCKLCEQLVGHLRDLLVANTTEEEFKQVLHGLCKQTKSFSTECAAIVDEYYPQIYEFLTKNLNGNAVCQMGGLCPAPGIKTQPIWPMVSQEHAEIALKVMNKNDKVKKTDEVQLPLGRLLVPGFPVIDDTHCATCEFVMNYVKKNGKNYNNKNEIMRVLKEVKDVLPSLGNSNSKKDVSGNSQKDFLNKYEMALAELISEGKDFSEICSLVAVCPSNQQLEAWEQIPSGFTIKSSIKNKPNCPLCLLAIEEMYKYIQNNKTEASIQEALDKLCIKLMPKSLKQECVDLVKVYSKELIQMLLKDMTPEEICEELKFCDPPQNKEHKSYFGDEIIAVPKNDIKGKEACAFCEYVLHYVQEAMTNPKSESEIAEIFKKICKKLPSSVKNDCQLFIEDYSSAMIAILVQEFDPSVVCPMIHLCPTAQLLESYKKTVQVEGTNLQYEDKPNCPLCLFGMSQLDNVIKNNKSKAAIAYAFEKLCSHLPTTLLDQCDSFVKNYSEKIYDMIIADFTPEEVCVYLKLCDPQKNVGPSITFFPLDKDGQIMTNEIPDYPMYQIESETVIIKDQSVKGDTECSICKTVIGFIEKELGTKKSKEDIENALHKVCNELPSQWTEKCNNFVNEYGEILIELITQDITPEQICISFQLCQSETKRLRESVAECALCQSIVSNIENLLSDSKTENLQEIMSNVCEQLPSTEQNKCTMMLEVYERSIVDTYMKYGPRKVCSKLSLCSSLDFLAMVRNNGRTRRQTRDKNLGTKPCTWGEAYWCLDNNTAEECKATEFCKRTGRLTASTSTTIKSSVDDRKVASEAELAVSKDGQVPS